MTHWMAAQLVAVILFVLMFCMYFFVVLVLSRVGKKCGVGSYLQFMIPIWNTVLLCDCAKVSRWVAVAVAVPGLILIPLNRFGIVVTPEALDRAGQLIVFLGNAYIWGKIAGRMGKNGLLWGFFTPVLAFVPTLVLAFGSAMPLDRMPKKRRAEETGSRYIDV